MTTMNDLFKEYLRRIEPSEQAVKRASEAHNPLCKDLEKDEEYGSYVDCTILSGSYGRQTAIFDIKDVDVILKTKFTKAELRVKKRENETVQKCLLRLTREAIERTERVASTEPARRSIYVELPNDDDDDMTELTMDLVPVLIQSDADTDPMTISDRELGEWLDTYPNTQLSDSVKRNANSKKINGKHSYKPTVKIFKAWKKVNYTRQKTPKGFILECLTAKYHNPSAITWLDAIHDLFQNICETWPDPDNLPKSPEIPSVADVSNSAPRKIPIAKSREQAQRVLKKMHQHFEIIQKAKIQAEEDGDLEKAAKTLQRVFGLDDDVVTFPLPSDLEDKNGGSRKSSSSSNVREAPPFA